MTTGTTKGEPTPGSVRPSSARPSSAPPGSARPDSESWLRWLERAAPTAAASVRKALDDAREGSVSERTGTLSARLAFNQLNQRVKSAPLVSSAENQAPFSDLPASDLVCDTAARIAFLVGLAEQKAPSEFTAILTALYRSGSDREQIGILRALPFLPDPASLVPLAREASRTNDVAVFSALACDSAFPARHLPDAAFEQLVLKALFIGVQLGKVRDLPTRVTPELQRMVGDFAEERRAAGRAVPADVPPLLELRSLGSERIHP